MNTLTAPIRVKPLKKNKVGVSVPPCKKCKYFDKETNSCKLFFSQSPMSGEVVYYDAEFTRMNDELCGGKLFKINPHNNINE